MICTRFEAFKKACGQPKLGAVVWHVRQKPEMQQRVFSSDSRQQTLKRCLQRAEASLLVDCQAADNDYSGDSGDLLERESYFEEELLVEREGLVYEG